MGTPDFAVPSLVHLHQAHQVLAVFCQPDRAQGRSRKPVACPVKQKALALGLPVHQPKRIRVRKWVRLLQELAPDVIAVAAFGQILSQEVLDVPKIDCLNVHASLLPRWRGASPIHHAIKSGDKQTGIGIMKMVLELDAGPVYKQEAYAIDAEIGRLALEKQLADLGARLLLETLEQLTQLEPVPQDPGEMCYAPIIGKDFGYLDPALETAETLANTARAYEGWPSLVTRFRGVGVKWHRVRQVPAETQANPGEIALVTKKRLCLACADNTWLELLEVQPSGKKSQPTAAFINGYHPRLGERFQSMLPGSG